MTNKQRLVAILGPTAVGKTEASIRLAERFNGEIVSADSRLVYRGMDIGTAKPTPEERQRVPHHLIDIVEPGEPFSLGAYRRQAMETIQAIQGRGRLTFLVGGTGQYVTAILEGWTPPPKPADASLRRELEAFAAQHGPQALHARLAAVDPARAAALDPRNVRRVVRALEIYQTTGSPPSRQRHKSPPPFQVLRLGLNRPRPELYARIDARLEAMLAAGWLDEVRRLLDDGVDLEAPSMSGIGYRELALCLRGEIDLEEAKRRIRRASRQFVRRQANWFKPDDPKIHWFEGGPNLIDEMAAALRAWLAEDSPLRS